MKKNFNDYISLSEKEIDIKFNKVFSKKEKILFDFLLKNKEDILSNNILVPILKIKKLLLLGELENILKIFQKLSEKIIIYTVFKLELIEKKGAFSIISSYHIEKNYIKVIFTEEFRSIFQKNSYFQKNDFDILLFFQNDYAIALYNFLKFNISMNKSIEISINKLKSLLGLEESYDRFFDFEKMILRPAFQEISKVTKKNIEYTKIKNRDSSNSKIIGLLLEIKDINEEEKATLTNSIIEKIEKAISVADIKKDLWTKVFKSLDDKSYDYIIKNVNYSIAHYPKNGFKLFFEEAIDLNYAENRFKNKIIKFSETFKCIENIEKKYTSLAQLHSDLFKILANLKFNYLTLNPQFLKSLQSLKVRKELEYFDNDFIIFAEYNDNEISYISLFEN